MIGHDSLLMNGKDRKKALSPWGVCSFLFSVLASHSYRFDTLTGEMANPVVQKWLSSQHPSGGGLGKEEVMLENPPSRNVLLP